MATHPDRYRYSQRLRPLAPKLPRHIVSPVQLRLQLEQNKEQDAEAATRGTANVKLHDLATSQSYTSASTDQEFTSPFLFQSNHTAEGKQHSAATSGANIYSHWAPLTLANSGFPELAPMNLPRGAVILESHGLSTHHQPYGSLQTQEAIPNRHSAYGVDCISMQGNPKDVAWATMVWPTIGVHENQSSQPTDPPVSTQQLPLIYPQYSAPLQPNSQKMTCVYCPSIWRTHLETIMFSDLEDKGISNLKCSYRHLQQHIQEAHLWHYGTGCSLCDNLLCLHLGKMMLLEAAKGDFTDVKIDLGNSFMTLREHIQEAHGGC